MGQEAVERIDRQAQRFGFALAPALVATQQAKRARILSFRTSFEKALRQGGRIE